jgi:hypothetical protein
MALNKLNVYASRIRNGVWQVELDGGWTPANLLQGNKLTLAKIWVNDNLPTEYHAYHEQGKDYEYVPREGTFSTEPSKPPKAKADPSQGQGDEDDDQGQGGGGDDEEYVKHAVYDPWHDKMDQDMANALEVCTGLATIAKDHGEFIADHTKRLDRVEARVNAISTAGVSAGNAGAVIVKVELHRPNIPAVPTEGVFHSAFPTLLELVASGQHTYLPGPPGTGKSHAAEQVAEALGWEFASLSLGPTTPESRLWGGRDANNNFHEPDFVRLARYAMDHPDGGAVFCLDELDNGHAGIIATANSAMANGWFSAPNNDRIKWGRNFVIVGAANTFGTGPTAEFAGRNRLDAATLDRFSYLPWDTDLGMESALVGAILAEKAAVAADWLDVWNSARKNVTAHGLKVFVTMRGAINGARLLATTNLDIYKVFDLVLLNKLPQDQKEKVSPL